MENKKYTPKPFTQQIAEQTFIKMYEPQDQKRTLCNVIKQAFRSVQDDSHNLQAARDLLLEALWIGQRMNDALTEKNKYELTQEAVEDKDDEYEFSIDWSKLDGRNVAKGNWD